MLNSKFQIIRILLHIYEVKRLFNDEQLLESDWTIESVFWQN
jgi:hypothetical protein